MLSRIFVLSWAVAPGFVVIAAGRVTLKHCCISSAMSLSRSVIGFEPQLSTKQTHQTRTLRA
jgi:hypothetical protein